MTRLFVRSGTALVPVNVDDVRWFEADGDYVVAHTASARHVLHVALSKLEARLDAARFARLHRTHLVNLAHVRSYRRVNGKLVAELTDGTRLPVSRAKAQELRAQGT
jgi:two-component system LytT family response regulator